MAQPLGPGEDAVVGKPAPEHPRTVSAPWSDAEVEALAARQNDSYLHPYTCPADGTHGSVKHSDRRILEPGPDGWWCPFWDCTYQQTWAWGADLLDVPTPGRRAES